MSRKTETIVWTDEEWIKVGLAADPDGLKRAAGTFTGTTGPELRAAMQKALRKSRWRTVKYAAKWNEQLDRRLPLMAPAELIAAATKKAAPADEAGEIPKLVFWKDPEYDVLADALHKSGVTNADAIKPGHVRNLMDLLPLVRRKRGYPTVSPRDHEGFAKAYQRLELRLKREAEQQAEAQRQAEAEAAEEAFLAAEEAKLNAVPESVPVVAAPAAPVVKVDAVDAALATLADSMAERFVNQFAQALVSKMTAAIAAALPQAMGQAMGAPIEDVTLATGAQTVGVQVKAPAAPRKVKIGVVGNSNAFEGDLKREFPDIDFVFTDKPKDAAAHIRHCDRVMALTKFISHSTDHAVKDVAGDKYVPVYGGLSSVRRHIDIMLKSGAFQNAA